MECIVRFPDLHIPQPEKTNYEEPDDIHGNYPQAIFFRHRGILEKCYEKIINSDESTKEFSNSIAVDQHGGDKQGYDDVKNWHKRLIWF
jgi:hypothetical protein